MSALLPGPGSVWRQTATQRQMRVIYSCETEIIAHNAEESDKHTLIFCWIGTADDFANQFEPGFAEHYPKTAA